MRIVYMPVHMEAKDTPRSGSNLDAEQPVIDFGPLKLFLASWDQLAELKEKLDQMLASRKALLASDPAALYDANLEAEMAAHAAHYHLPETDE